MIEHVVSTRDIMAKMKSGEISTDRKKDELRNVDVTLDFTPNALSSLLYKQGDTTVLVCVTKAPSLPRWFPKNSDRGWVHAEYSLLPGSTDTRFRRERNGAKGRTMEIERLVARSLRGAVDLEALGPLALTVDCDILNADGGTRCASITAACIALRLAIRRLIDSGDCLPKELRPTREDISNGWTAPELTNQEKQAHELRVMANDVSAISVGLIDGEVFLDLDYILDSNADVDMNVVGTSDGMFVEVQGTGEEATYSRKQFDALMDMAEIGLKKLQEIQSDALREI
tara:strand:- start:2206 stop:3063 length:858 start_codon:yes stop_codon:yes gene_type:complete